MELKVNLFGKEYNLQQLRSNYTVFRFETDADFLLVGERKGDINIFALKDDGNTVKKRFPPILPYWTA